MKLGLKKTASSILSKGLDENQYNWKRKITCLLNCLPSLSEWIDPLDNSCSRNWRLHKFCFSRRNSSGYIITCEALYNSRTALMPFKHPPSELKNWSSVNFANGSAQHDQEANLYLYMIMLKKIPSFNIVRNKIPEEIS